MVTRQYMNKYSRIWEHSPYVKSAWRAWIIIGVQSQDSGSWKRPHHLPFKFFHRVVGPRAFWWFVKVNEMGWKWIMSLTAPHQHTTLSTWDMFCTQAESLAGFWEVKFWIASLKKVTVLLNEHEIYIEHCDKLPAWWSPYDNCTWHLFHE